MQTMDLAIERLFSERKIGGETAVEHASDKEAMQRITSRG
jgi:hypothetical protein